MTSRVYHGYQQDLSQLRSALPILPLTQRPDFQLIFKRLLSKSACLRGSAPDPARALQRPQTPSWKRLVLTTMLKNRSRAWLTYSAVLNQSFRLLCVFSDLSNHTCPFGLGFYGRMPFLPQTTVLSGGPSLCY